MNFSMSVLLLESDASRIEISPPDQPSALKSIHLSLRGRFSADSKQVPSIDARTVHKASLSLQIIFHPPSYVRFRFRGHQRQGSRSNGYNLAFGSSFRAS